ncbi:hypothetical protein ACFV6F_27565 [Kitasatospora phosalacinea]|uniref:hypothetical protein n=1 Tax=Kitasatospora phosalacinea TaxID=2065 RepID=UPI00365905BF
MPAHAETNVRLPLCALAALATVQERWGTSRDETVRRLLADHVALQEERAPEDRLTHISTVLRYPAPPRWRGEPRRNAPLRVRASAELLQRARMVSLTLPGQYERAHRDYQGRTLTDAVVTAIWRAEHFTDGFLDGLLPVLRHRSALALWQLTTAVTSTDPEKELILEALKAMVRMKNRSAVPADEVAEARLLGRAADVLQEETAWHAPARFQAAARLARDKLTGPRAELFEQQLYDQRDLGNPLFLEKIRTAGRPPRAWGALSSYDWTGRGGTAVWRAHRRAEVEDFEDWLTSRTEHDVERVTARPGWLIRTPAAWRAHTLRGSLPEPFAAWAAAGQLLAFPYGEGRQGVWPLLRPPGRAGGWALVPGTEPLVAAAADVPPDRINCFIEAQLVEWNHEFANEPALRIALDLPADQAHAFGFITADEQHRLSAAADAATWREMNAIIDTHRDTLEEPELRQLLEARDKPHTFRRRALWLGLRGEDVSRFTVAPATWQWPGRSVAAELLAGAPAVCIQWLAASAYRSSCLLLEQSMQEAWHQAFDRYGRRV